MSIPSSLDFTAATRANSVAKVGHRDRSNADWRCSRCDKLLGVRRDGHMHLRFARGHEYLVGFPVTATCRGCGTLNRTAVPTAG